MKPRVLLFEDNAMLRSTLEGIISDLGFEIHTFSDPGMCPLHYSSKHGCLSDDSCADIIISDVNMPVQSGLEFVSRRLDNGCKIKFRALMSADWNESDLQHAVKIGCKVFHKPFELEELLKWLHNCREEIDHRRVLAEWSTETDKPLMG